MSDVLFVAPGEETEESDSFRLEMIETHGFRIYEGDELVCDRAMDYPSHKEARSDARQQMNWLRKKNRRPS
jgi:hypothetical protein